MWQNLSIGLGLMTFSSEPVLQIQIVFDYPVVSDKETARAILVRMRIGFTWTAVRRPASVSNPAPDKSLCGLKPFYFFLKGADPAYRSNDIGFSLVDDCDPARIISAVFQ